MRLKTLTLFGLALVLGVSALGNLSIAHADDATPAPTPVATMKPKKAKKPKKMKKAKPTATPTAPAAAPAM